MNLSEDRDYQNLVLAALLHDIGKFWQRTGLEAGRRHPELGGWFCREHLGETWKETEDIAANHHLPEATTSRNPRLTLTVALADWLASGERRELDAGETGQPGTTPLQSILSRLASGDTTPNRSDSGHVPVAQFPLAALPADGDLKPSAEAGATREGYAALWREFDAEFRAASCDDFALMADRILALLEKYTLLMPSAVWKSEPDISLFHHLKLTAGIAACLYRDGLDAEALNEMLAVFRQGTGATRGVAMLIGGDISGIQDFIYNLTAKGALKGLRGRSAYLQLVAEAIAGRVLDEFGLTRANLLYCGGGHFYVLAPAVEDAQARFDALESEISESLLDAHQGKLGVVLTVHALGVLDFRRDAFGRAWDGLHGSLALAKKQKFHTSLARVLAPQGSGGEPKACVLCGTESLERDDEKRCPMCAGFADLSQRLTNACTLTERPTNRAKGELRDWRDVLAALGRSYAFVKTAAPGSDAWLLNDTRIGAGYRGFRFLATSLPQGKDGTATLEELAGGARGVQRWGILRADVDELGRAFKEGLGSDRSISRLSMLSYLLSYFFSARVPAVIREEQFRDSIYLAYSGGDDLFAVGAWSVLPDLAQRLNDEFRRFASERLSLSAGIAIAPTPGFPVYEAADLAGAAVDSAKEAGRSRLCIFNRSVTWTELADASAVLDRLDKLLEQGLPRSLLTTLQKSWLDRLDAKAGTIKMFPLWRLFYAFKRLKERHKDLASPIDDLEKAVVRESDLHPYLDLIVRWAELANRRSDV